MFIELHYIDADGVDRGPLPDSESVSLSPVFCDYGSFSFKYPVDGMRRDLFADRDEFEIVPWIGGVAYPRFGGLVREQDGDDVEEAGFYSYTGIGYLTLLDEARVYPRDWPTYDKTDPVWKFSNASAGTILKTFINAAQARGSLPNVTHASWSTTTDSSGATWTKAISLEIKPGATITTVLKNLYENGMCEFRMNGRDLQIYNPDTLGTDRTTGTAPLIFRKGRDLTDSPRKLSSREVSTVMLAAGKEDTGLYHEEVDSVAVGARRRIEGFISNGNVTDAGTLDAYATAVLTTSTKPKMEKAHGLSFADAGSPRPITNFDVGDWSYSDVGKGLERLRIKQWVLNQNANGLVSGSVVLNDLFAEMTERLARRVEGIVGGSTITGESRATDAAPGVLDTMPPKTPAGLAATSDAYEDNKTGQTYSQVTASWLQVTENEDSTALEDLLNYRIRWRPMQPADLPWRGILVDGNQTSTSWSPVTTGIAIEVQVRAEDRVGNVSLWSASVTLNTATDATAPPVPAAPVVDNYLGLLRIQWTGWVPGGSTPPDFLYTEVHVSTVNNFTPADSTLLTTLSTFGYAFHEAAYGVTTYVKLVSVDRSKNKSAASAQASGSTAQVVSADVFDGAIGTAKLADAAITTAKINDLAVNDAKIGSLNVGKLTAGTMSADVVVGGRFATALTGARVEVNSLGLQKFSSTGALLVNITGTEALLTGIYKTAASGKRVEIGVFDATPELRLYSDTDLVGKIRGFTFSGGAEAFNFVVPIKDTWARYWNSLQVQDTNAIWLISRRVNLTFGGSDHADAVESKIFIIHEATDEGTPTTAYTVKERLRIDVDNFWYRDTLGQLRILVGRDGTWIYDNGGRERIGMNTGSMTFYDPQGATWMTVRSTDSLLYNTNTGKLQQWWQDNGDIHFYLGVGYGDPNLGWVAFDNAPHTGQGAWIKSMSSNNWGVTFKAEGTNGSGADYRAVLRDATDSGMAAITARSFDVASDESGKENITPAVFDAMASIRKTAVKKYRRSGNVPPKMDPETREVVPAEPSYSSEEVGLIAQEAPPQIVRGQPGNMTVDLYQMTTLLWKALQEIDGRLSQLETRSGK